MKKCTKCKIEKELSEFHKNKTKPDGYAYWCKECKSEYRVQYNIKNKEKIRKFKQIYYLKNKEKQNIYQKEYKKNRRKNDIEFRLLSNFRTRFGHALKNNSKSDKTINLLGCTIPQLKLYLETKFTKGMSWDNYGIHGWHIDHIIPCANFDMVNKKDQKACFHFTNLQPLWAKDNYCKPTKILEKL